MLFRSRVSLGVGRCSPLGRRSCGAAAVRTPAPSPFGCWAHTSKVRGARSRPVHARGPRLSGPCCAVAAGARRQAARSFYAAPRHRRGAAAVWRRRSRLAAAGTAWPGPDSTSGGGGVSGPCDGLRGGGGVRGPCWPGPASSAVR